MDATCPDASESPAVRIADRGVRRTRSFRRKGGRGLCEIRGPLGVRRPGQVPPAPRPGAINVGCRSCRKAARGRVHRARLVGRTSRLIRPEAAGGAPAAHAGCHRPRVPPWLAPPDRKVRRDDSELFGPAPITLGLRRGAAAASRRRELVVRSPFPGAAMCLAATIKTDVTPAIRRHTACTRCDVQQAV